MSKSVILELHGEQYTEYGYLVCSEIIDAEQADNRLFAASVLARAYAVLGERGFDMDASKQILADGKRMYDDTELFVEGF